VETTTKNQKVNTNLCVLNKIGQAKPHLAVEVMSNGGVLYNIFLFEIYDHETKLNSGRFVNFDNTLSDNQAAFMAESTNRTIFAGLEFESIGHLIQRQVEWCAESTFKDPSHWNLSLDPHHVSKMGISFFFDDVTTAVTFKLLWS
jgi:hypothetical protein